MSITGIATPKVWVAPPMWRDDPHDFERVQISTDGGTTWSHALKRMNPMHRLARTWSHGRSTSYSDVRWHDSELWEIPVTVGKQYLVVTQASVIQERNTQGRTITARLHFTNGGSKSWNMGQEASIQVEFDFTAVVIWKVTSDWGRRLQLRHQFGADDNRVRGIYIIKESMSIVQMD